MDWFERLTRFREDGYDYTRSWKSIVSRTDFSR
jgi:hypothetical protein